MKVNFLDKKDQIEKYFNEKMKDDVELYEDNSLFEIRYNELEFYFLDEGACTIDENFKVEIPKSSRYENKTDSGIVISVAELLKFLGELFKGGNKNVSI